MIAPDNTAVASKWFGLRFSHPATERKYREWRIATAIPFARLGYVGSAPSWTLLLLAIFILDPASIPTAAPAITGWIALLAALTALTFWNRAQGMVMPLAAIANCLAGFLVAWLLHDAVGGSLDASVRSGLMTGGVLIVMYFGFAIFRIPPSLAMAAVSPYVGFAMVYLYSDFKNDALGPVAAGGFAACQFIAYMGGILVCTVIEILSRQNFSSTLKLNEANDLIRRFLPTSVANHIISGDPSVIDKPKRQSISVLFSDIQGFTNLTDTLEPEVTAQILDEYMSAMSDIVDVNGGTLNEFMGDGLIAIFGAPDELPRKEHAQRALRTAQDMQKCIPDLEEKWRLEGNVLNLKVRIGINTGMANVGSFGSKGRRTYTAIGLNVNIAARIQAHCAPGGILISDTTYQLIRDKVECESQAEVDCKGVHFPVKVYAPTQRPVMPEKSKTLSGIQIPNNGKPFPG